MEEKKINEVNEDLFSKFRGTSMFPESMISSYEEKDMIEDIAWKVFQRETGLRFKRELTPEEKIPIIEHESYQNYRDKAKTIYEKKLKALNNKKYPIIDVPSSGKKSWMGGAYCLCFVYSKYNGNFVLKGYIKEVEEYLKKNHTHYFCNKSLWSGGFNRDIWSFWKKDVGIFNPSKREKSKGKNKITVRPYSEWWEDNKTTKEKDKMELEFKRLPKRWIPEFDNF